MDGLMDDCRPYEAPARGEAEGMPESRWMKKGKSARANHKRLLGSLLNELSEHRDSR